MKVFINKTVEVESENFSLLIGKTLSTLRQKVKGKGTIEIVVRTEEINELIGLIQNGKNTFDSNQVVGPQTVTQL